MKRFQRIIYVTSILIGLLLFAACNESTDTFRAVNTQTDTRDLSDSESKFEEYSSIDEEGYQRLTIFNENGTMKNTRIPFVEEIEISEEEKAIRAVAVETFRMDQGKSVRVAREQGVVSGSRIIQDHQRIVVLFLGDGFRSTEQHVFENKVAEAESYLKSTYPY